MEVNRRAPLVVRKEIEIFAPPEMIWEWLSRVDLWQDWHPEISSSRWLAGRGVHGTFKWRLRKVLGVTCQMESWNELSELGWVAQVWSSTLRQVFRISGDFRRTRIVAEASIEGPGYGFAPLRSAVQTQLERTSELWLAALKTKLESEKVRTSIGSTAASGLPKRRGRGSAAPPSKRPRIR